VSAPTPLHWKRNFVRIPAKTGPYQVGSLGVRKCGFSTFVRRVTFGRNSTKRKRELLTPWNFHQTNDGVVIMCKRTEVSSEFACLEMAIQEPGDLHATRRRMSWRSGTTCLLLAEKPRPLPGDGQTACR
jgi:hypothetical protein